MGWDITNKRKKEHHNYDHKQKDEKVYYMEIDLNTLN